MSTATVSTPPSTAAALLRTPLHDLHLELGARMVPFAGHALPLQYAGGLLQEHLHTRNAASLFDVSHMGQLHLSGADVAAFIERIAPTDAVGLAPGRQRYALLLAEDGGILDDVMFARLPACAERSGPRFAMVLNGAVRAADLAHLRQVQAHMLAAGHDITLEPHFERALLALQGPAAQAALSAVLPEHTATIAAMRFMDVLSLTWQATDLLLARSGYSGEDGFEIALPAAAAQPWARALLAQAPVKPAGLGARNSLRLEAGLCLYGQDMDRQTTLVEADLGWTVPQVRRSGGARAGGFLGAALTLAQLAHTAKCPNAEYAPRSQRIALIGQERVPVRAGTPLVAAPRIDAPVVGSICSGILSPTLDRPIAFARVQVQAVAGSQLYAVQRGKVLPMLLHTGPFVATRYRR